MPLIGDIADSYGVEMPIMQFNYASKDMDLLRTEATVYDTLRITDSMSDYEDLIDVTVTLKKKKRAGIITNME